MGIDDRHSINRAAFIIKGCRVNNVICTDNYGYICHRHLWIHFIRCLKLLIRNISLCKKYVHMSRHSSRNRVDSEVYFSTVIFKLLRKLLNGMLSLSNRHTVTWYKYYILSSFKNHIGIFCRNSLCLSSVTLRAASASAAKASEEKTVEASVHCLTHYKSKNKSRCTHKTAGYYKHRIIYCKTGKCCCKSRKGIQERNNNRHISTADAHYQSNTCDKICSRN